MNTGQDVNRWKGFVAGMIGSVAGLIAMQIYWQRIAPIVNEQLGSNSNERDQNEEPAGGNGSLDDISLIGQQYRDDESATAALGRIFYRQLTGRAPETEEAKTMLSYLVHWAYGMFQGGLYTALRSDAQGLDLGGGLVYASGLWLFGDEMAVPLLGLQAGPTAVPLAQHANRWGAHLAYGLGTAVASHTLRRLV